MGLESSTSSFDAAFISQVASPLKAIDVQSNSECPFQIKEKFRSKAEDNNNFKVAKTGDSRAPIAIYQNPINSMNVNAQSPFDNNTGYHCGGINAAMGTPNMMGTPCPFTRAQLVELEQQIRIYKCINENSPIPSDLLMALSASLNPNQLISFPRSDATNAGKHVQGETNKVYESAPEEAALVGGSASISTPCGGVATAQYQSINFPSDAEGLGVGLCVNKVKDPQSHIVTSPATSMGFGFPSSGQNFDKPVLSEFAEDEPDMNLNDYFLDFSDLESQERCSLRHLFDNWPAEQPEYADWSNLSMKNIPIGLSDQTPTSPSSQQKKLM
ncbi:uncharacterized protein LOC127799840 [Diospyros lotus]|uniref:uncharacterized protein LOC127799840 n=1 Tax=Diospyros lotus TaxID=55363 RepID=UPI00225BE048|nr:uncharacterized protein LOC127799840 [Diospyros lotus]